MTDLITDISALLLKQYLFHGLNVDQIKQIAAKFRVVRYQPNHTVIYDDMPGLYFYIVYKGRVEISTVIKKFLRPKRIVKLYTYSEGNYFGDEAIVFKHNNKDIAKTIEESVLLVMDNETFKELLESYPEIKNKIRLTAESRRLARTKLFPWFADGESIQLMGRKHWFFLFRSLILPILFFLLFIPVSLFTFTQLDTTPLHTLFKIGSLVLMGASFFWGIYNWLDWGNDYYIVTTQRVVWLEKMIGLYDNRNEAPLYTILTVNVTSSQLGRILGYGNVTTRTYTGDIKMHRVEHPNDLGAYIEGHIKRLLQISKVAERSQIKEDIQKALKRQEPTEVDLEELVIEEKKIETQTEEKRSPADAIQSFLKVRVEQGGEITYRKHWFLLFQKSWVPLLMLFVVIAFMTLIIPRFSTSIEDAQAGSMAILCTIFGIAGLIAWLVYAYVDWINDIYKLTPEQIFQIYRKPLGTEIKKSASIENILSISHERENIIGILLNFGTVTVAVGDTELIFEGVFNPDQVHQDIADYQEALMRRKNEEQSLQERKRMVEWLAIYDEERQKKTEIPPESDQISG